jgi:hypothetical protein
VSQISKHQVSPSGAVRVTLVAVLTLALVPALALAAPGDPTAPRSGPPIAVQPQYDKVAPHLLLTGARRQHLAPRLGFYATCSERCEFDAEARVRGVHGIRTVKVFTPAKASNGGRRVRFEIKVTGRAAALLRRAFKQRERPRLSVTVSAIDLAQNETVRKLFIRVVPAS